MSGVVLATKTCGNCGEEKPVTGFYRNKRAVDGLAWDCRDCARQRVDQSQARRRDEMGDAAFRAQKAEATRRSRRNPEVADRLRRNHQAYYAAVAKLRDAHRAEFDRLLAVERYERGLT